MTFGIAVEIIEQTYQNPDAKQGDHQSCPEVFTRKYEVKAFDCFHRKCWVESEWLEVLGGKGTGPEQWTASDFTASR